MPSDEEFVLEAPATVLAAPVARATAAAVAMAHDVAFDEITDLRLAVDEACSLLLPLAAPNTTLRCAVRVQATGVDVVVRVTSTSTSDPIDSGAVDLHILRALATEVETRTEPAGQGTVRLQLHLSLTRQGV